MTATAAIAACILIILLAACAAGPALVWWLDRRSERDASCPCCPEDDFEEDDFPDIYLDTRPIAEGDPEQEIYRRDTPRPELLKSPQQWEQLEINFLNGDNR